MARDVAGRVEGALRMEAKSFCGFHDDEWTRKLKAMPGYDNVYVPYELPVPVDGGRYSPGNVGPKTFE